MQAPDSAMARIITAASLMLQHADWCEANGGDPRASMAAARWCARPLANLVDAEKGHRAESRALAMDEPPGRA